jgi:hypothetical protein
MSSADKKITPDNAETITPERAKELLTRSKPNRVVNERNVIAIALDIEAGRWDLNGETIKIAPSGRILDGQHRLLGCVLANKPFRTLIAYDINEKTFKTIDMGRFRTAADILQTEGYVSTTTTASAARRVRNYISGGSLDLSLTRLVVTDFVAAHPYLNTICKMVDPIARSFPRTPLATVLYLANTNRSYELETIKFLEGVHSGANLQKGDPRLTLREWYRYEAQHSRSGKSVSCNAATGATIRAWNAYASGKSMSAIRMISTVNREAMPIVGFERVKFRDVPDIGPRLNVVGAPKRVPLATIMQNQRDLFEERTIA